MSLPIPDWTKNYKTSKAIESDLAPKFKYKGEGWYLTKDDTLFVTQHGVENFYVQVWNYPTARREIAVCLAKSIRITEGEV